MLSLEVSAESRVAACLRSSPALEAAEIFELEIIELDEFTEIESGLVIAEIERGEFAGLAAKVGKCYVRLIPVLKRQLAFDAAIVRLRNHAHGVVLIVPIVLLADLDLANCRQAGRVVGEGNRVFILS